ncbi:hypothetical protein D3C73_969070 [compost metagenome]
MPGLRTSRLKIGILSGRRGNVKKLDDSAYVILELCRECLVDSSGLAAVVNCTKIFITFHEYVK